MINNQLFNRELSWLSFNYRVLQEAKDPSVPLYDRIKFLAIYSSNLDEFFRVRVASLRSLLSLKKKKIKKLKIDPLELLKQIHSVVNKQQEEFGSIYRDQIIPEFEKNNIFIVNNENLSPAQTEFLNDFFTRELKPYLQPMLLDKKVETFLQNKIIYKAVRLKIPGSENVKKKRFKYGLLEIPSARVGRFIKLPEADGKNFVILIDDVIQLFLPQLFSGYEIESSYNVKLTRDAELYIDDEFTGNLLDKIKKSLSKRNTGVPCRFLYDSKMPKDFLKFLRNCIRLNKDDLIPGGKYHNFNDFFSFPEFNSDNSLENKLKYESFPALRSKIFDGYSSVFETVSRQDILIHFPYQSYDYVINFLNEAADDPEVKAIYITLYRVASGSGVVKALSKAALNGKKVVAFVEVKARFDEELNFSSAEELQRAGVLVHYSFPGLKVHAKICLISRIENNTNRYYAYFSTGNFNEKTAKIYSDYGLFTKDERLTNDAAIVFEILTKSREKEIISLQSPKFEHLLVAPFNLRSTLEELITKEIENAAAGRKSFIKLKLNSLEDKKMIRLLYKAAEAGVKINIIVRGICCLVPLKNIRVTSIVDRFLEHSRVYIFCNNGDEKIFISSADWMTRNLSRRIETCIPVFDKKIKKQLQKLMSIQFKDNVKARVINKFQNNKYRKNKSKLIRAQYDIYDYIKSINSESENKLKIKT